MRFLVLPCAKRFLCQVRRVHFTCLFCKDRKRWLGKYSTPKKFVSWVLPWSVRPGQRPQAIFIDPRGNAHVKFFRCCAIIRLVHLADIFWHISESLQPRAQDVVCRVTMKRLMNAAELIANLTV